MEDLSDACNWFRVKTRDELYAFASKREIRTSEIPMPTDCWASGHWAQCEYCNKYWREALDTIRGLTPTNA
jgi:hypothetical protein